MNSLRIAKSLFLKDNPHLLGDAPRGEAPRWVRDCLLQGDTFIPHFYAPSEEIRNALIDGERTIVLDMEKAPIRGHLEELLAEVRILFSDVEEVVCLNAEFMESELCTRRVYRHQSPIPPCIPPLPPFRKFYSERLHLNLDQLVWRLEHLYDVREKEALLSLILFLITNNGKEFNYRRTASLLNIRFETLKSFIGYLEKGFLVRIVESREGGPKSRRISLITDWRIVNHLMDRQPLEIFLSPVEPASVFSYRFLEMYSRGEEVYLEDILDKGDIPPT